jgi:Nucleotidyltransferase of unknown function (DUF6036)
MIDSAPPEHWNSFLKEVDDFLTEETHFHCLGGFVVTQLYGLDRATRDIDVMSIVPRSTNSELIDLAGKGSKLHSKYRIYLDRVGVVTVPEDYAERLTEMYPDAFKHLRLLAFDPYDLALSKIERNIERDRNDVLHLAKTTPFDLEFLKRRYTNELRPYLGNPEREDLTLRLWVDMINENCV